MALKARDLALVAVALAAAPPAAALEGRYLGSAHRVDGAESEDFMRHLFELGGRQVLPQDLDLRLRMSLQYQARPGEPASDLLRSRFDAELRRGSLLRLDARLEPWQDTTPGGVLARQRQSRLGLVLSPRNAPVLNVQVDRLDRETAAGLSFSDNRRIEASYTRAGVSSEVGYRRIDATPAGFGAATSRTEEWRGGLRTSRNWRGVAVQAGYDALASRFATRDRRRDQWTQRLDLGGSWTPLRQLTIGASGFDRWGETTDNALPGAQGLDERSLGGNIAYRPRQPLLFELGREYRVQAVAAGRSVTDYLQFRGTYRQPVRRGMQMQTGYLLSADLGRDGGSVPNNAVYGLLDGTLRAGMQARAEVRAARAASGPGTGTQWHRLLQLRTRPTPATRADVTWSRSTAPQFEGLAQEDRTWEILGGWDPIRGMNLSGSHRRLDGGGRIDRRERQTSLVSAWRPTPRSSVSLNWTRRTARTFTVETRSTVTGLDFDFWLPGEVRAHASWRESSTSGVPLQRSYGVSLERRF